MKTMYRLPCRCGQEHLVEATQAGQSIRCRCGKDLEIPTLQGLKRLVRVEASEPPRPAARPWGRRQRRVLLGVVIAALGVALSAYVYLHRPQFRDVEVLSPYQSLLLWDTYSRGVGELTGEERAYFEYLRQNNQRLKATLAVAAAGVLVMLSALAIPKQPAEKKRKRR